MIIFHHKRADKDFKCSKQSMQELLSAKLEHDEHALWQLYGFHSTLKILVISGSQTLRLSGSDMKFHFCHGLLYIESSSVPPS